MANRKKNGWKMDDGMFFGEYNLEGANSLKEYLETRESKIKDKTFREMNLIMKLLKPSITRHRILVIPCNYGRIAIELSKKGFDVNGVDDQEEQIKLAYELACKNKVNTVFMYRKLTQVNFKEEFDIIISIIYSFGLLKKMELQYALIAEEVYNALKPGGRFFLLFDRNPLAFAKGYNETLREKLNNGKEIFMEEKYNAKDDKVEGRYSVKDAYGSVKEDFFSVPLIYEKEIFQICKNSGLINPKCYGDAEGTICNPSSENLIFIAEKPQE